MIVDHAVLEGTRVQTRNNAKSNGLQQKKAVTNKIRVRVVQQVGSRANPPNQNVSVVLKEVLRLILV